MDWWIRAKELLQTMNQTEVAEIIQREYLKGSTKEKVFDRIRKRAKLENVNVLKYTKSRDVVAKPTKTEQYSNGVLTVSQIIELPENATPEDIVKAHGLDPNKWQVVSYVNNYWDGSLTGGDSIAKYQSKISVRPRLDGLTFDDIDEYFENKKIVSIPSLIENYDKQGEILEVCLPDLHGGLLAWRGETGHDYDLKIAVENFTRCIHDILLRCKYRKLKQIYFVTLGDLLHFDNEEQKTTKGTQQQADGRTAKIHDAILDMLIDGIRLLANIAPVEVIYLSGNHDRVTGRMLMKAVECWYQADKNITFDMEANPHKYKLIGKNLIGWTHGDMDKKNMYAWLQERAKREYGQCEYAEIHCGHFHSQNTKERTVTIKDHEQTFEQGGVVVRYLPTIANASLWEHGRGYAEGVKTMMSFIWHEELGLREMWFSNV